MIAGPLTGRKTDHYTGALTVSGTCRHVRCGCASGAVKLLFGEGETMRKLSSRAAGMAAVAVVGLLAPGCSQIGMLKGKMAFRDANTLYKGQDYRGAAAKYEEAIQQDPDLVNAYFFLGNSYDNLYRPSRRGEPANDELINKAIANYQISAQREP